MSLAARCQPPPGPDADEAPGRRVVVVQGEYLVSDEPDLVLTTILGSCVAACLRDPVARVGGMNHFLLPGDGDGLSEGVRYGVQAMELLVNGLLRRGARRDRLEAKLFGGGRMISGLTDVGAQNAAFAQRFLKDEGIACVGASLGGERARRVQYWPVSGRARQICLAAAEASPFVAERRLAAPRPLAVDAGALELF